jgi:hypothetical protein
MKTTLDIPDVIFRRAKAKAAEQNVPLRQFVSDALKNTDSSAHRSAFSERVAQGNLSQFNSLDFYCNGS